LRGTRKITAFTTKKTAFSRGYAVAEASVFFSQTLGVNQQKALKFHRL